MRVAFVTSGYPPISPGGAGISSQLIVEGLRDNGIDVDVFALVGKNRTRIKAAPGVWHLPRGEEYPVPKAIGENLSSYLHLPDLKQYDIIHVYNVRHLPACVVRSSAPIIATMNNHLWICIDPTQHLHDGLPECTVRRTLRYADSAGYSGLKRFPRTAIEYLGKSLARSADAFTVQTNGMKDVMNKCGYGSSDISVVGNILDSDFETEIRKKNKIVFVGRLIESKAPDMVIEAYAGLSSELKQEWDLELYGEGPMKQQLKTMIRERNLDTVTLGRIRYQNLPDVYAEAELLVHPSRYTEPFSRTWLEAMASGTPIVCSDNPSSRDILDGVAQFHDPFDSGSVTDTLTTVLTDSSLRDEMRRVGRKQVEHYRPDIIIQKYFKLYEKLQSS
jgi:glycosyltransferase involved in cell wall biosynthesis